MRLPRFENLPATIEEASSLPAENGAIPLAGGTDLLVKARPEPVQRVSVTIPRALEPSCSRAAL